MSDNYTDVLLEDMNTKFDAILEVVGQLRDDMKNTAQQADLESMQSDVNVIKAAVIDTSHQVNQLDERVAKLEAA